MGIRDTVKRIVTICSFCKKIKDRSGGWRGKSLKFIRESRERLSHGICPCCFHKHYGQFLAEIKD